MVGLCPTSTWVPCGVWDMALTELLGYVYSAELTKCGLATSRERATQCGMRGKDEGQIDLHLTRQVCYQASRSLCVLGLCYGIQPLGDSEAQRGTWCVG